MHARSLNRHFATSLAVLCLAAASLQTAVAEDDDVVVVTGSRVARSELAINSPVVRIDAEAIERSGAVNVEDLLRQLPQTLAGVSPGVNLGNPGVATLDLRGLRGERTLVLVDGKRFVPYDYGGIVDVNNIPVALLESIEIVTGGASAVYGSDAMAGVVNFKLKHDFEGLDFGTHYSRSSRDDGDTKDFSLTAGKNFGGGRGNAVLSLGWTDRDPVGTSAREFSRFAFTTSTGGIGGSVVNPEGTLFCYPYPCYPTGLAGGAPDYISFAPNGDLADIGDRLFNYNAYNYLQVPQERLQGTALLNFDFSDRVNAYGRLSAIDSKVDSAIAPSGTFFTRTFTVPLSSPGLSAQARQVLTDRVINGTTGGGPDGLVDGAYDVDGNGVIDANAVTNDYFAWRALALGARETLNHSTAWQAVAGLRGSLAGDWRWDASLQHGRTRLTRDYTNDVSEARMQASILGCPPGSPAGCVAGNFFGSGNLSQEAADFIRLNIGNKLYSTQQVATASFSGTLGGFHLPRASAIGAAFGLEYRREKSDSFPDDCLGTPGCSGGYGVSFPVRADYSVKELFGELLVPLIEGARFANKLELETGVRLSDYSNIGDATTYKLGGSWSPVSSAFRVRGLYQKAVRAPNIFEFGSPVQQNRGSASSDPCSGNPTGALRDLCLATGVPLAAITNVPNVINGQINIFTGGNPDLTEEESDTYTAGFVWAPGGAFEGANLQLDWYRIKIENAITTLAPNDVLQACYSAALNPTFDPSTPACALLLRNPATGGLVGDPAYGVSSRNENIALLRTQGVDLTLDYSMETSTLGRFNFTLNGTRVFNNDRQASLELPTRECVGRYGSSCGVPDPKLRFRQETVWTIGEFDLGYRWRYLKGTAIDNPAAAVPQFQSVGDRHYVDLMLGWKPAQLAGVSLRVGINNMLDKDPPLVGEDAGPADRNSGNTYPGTFDVLGRTFFVSATLRL